MEFRFFGGIDIGSSTIKVVVIDDSKNIIFKTVGYTGARPKRNLEELLKGMDISKEDVLWSSTGYGRNLVKFASFKLSEIQASAKGAYFFFDDVRTVIDIGGQDSKAIRVGENGLVLDFAMNDKCASGTGRFLEVMAKALELDIDEMPLLHKKAKKIVNISNICAVFAESEVVSLVANDEKVEDIVKGIHYSVAKRTVSLINRIGGMLDRVVMSGGVALNEGVKEAIENLTGHTIYISPYPQLQVAIGAALYSYEKAS